MWRKLRIFVASCCFIAICLLFVDLSGILHEHLAFLAKIQLVPAILSGCLLTLCAFLGLSLLFGRVYCSTICPLGILQDLLAKCKKKRKYAFRSSYTKTRLSILIFFICSWLFSIPLVFSLLEPYSAFGRIATNIFAPIWAGLSNILAYISEYMGNYAVAPSSIHEKGLASLGVATLTFIIIGILAIKNGRTWCNAICPVGTVLGYLNHLALCRPRINPDKCVQCGYCTRICKSSCIDIEHKTLDASRCIHCYNCHDACKFKAISLIPLNKNNQSKQTINNSRRSFIKAIFPLGITSTSLSSKAIAATYGEAKKSGANNQRQIVALSTAKTRPTRKTPIMPAGSLGLRHFEKYCTSCQLCVAVCPHDVLHPYDIGSSLLQPSMTFEHGFCRINCIECSKVCPTSAIQPITIQEKSIIQCGQIKINLEACIVNADKLPCTACTRICPTDAISLISTQDNYNLKIPVVDNAKCLGCGACEYACWQQRTSSFGLIF